MTTDGTSFTVTTSGSQSHPSIPGYKFSGIYGSDLPNQVL